MFRIRGSAFQPQCIVAGLTSAGDSHVYRVSQAFTCIPPIESVGHRRFNMAYIALGVGFLLVVGLMVGGAIVSTGSGAAVSGTNSAKSSWAGSGNVSGSMTPTFANGEIFTGRFCHQRQRKVSSFLELGRGSGGMSAQPSNFSGKRVIILPGDRSRYEQHTHTLWRASIARAKRAFIMEM